jgi:ABC-type nitrate/sulfonate/bicarbonate transport system permease component
MSAVDVEKVRTAAPATLEPAGRLTQADERPRAPRAIKQPSFVSRISVPVWRVLFLIAVLVLWHLASIPAGKLLLPSPLAVAPAFWNMLISGELPSAAASSLVVFFGGYLLAAVSGVALGVMMGGMRRVGETLEIYVNGINSTPRVAFIPLIILWFGLDTDAKIMLVWLMALFPIVLNTYAGVLNTDAELVEAARSFGAKRGQIFRYIMLPAAVPYVVTGLRLGASNAMVGTIVAELYTALSGLGFLIAQFGGTFQTAKYFGPVLVLGMFGMIMSQSLKALERRLAAWKSSRVEI